MLVAVRAALILVVALAAASCGESDPTSAPEGSLPLTAGPDSTAGTDSTPPDSAAGTDSTAGMDSTLAADTLGSSADSVVTTAATAGGVPFGPYGLFANVTDFEWGPAPFTSSLDNTFSGSIVQRISAARQKGHRLLMAMTGGNSSEYTTNGKFDLAKWKARMGSFNTAAIKKAVADGVADGTIVGNKLIDEPETPKWGGVLTKPKIDDMARYVKSMFPTLPVGISYGAPGFKWRTSERYQVVDFVVTQYAWAYNSGNVTAWRDEVLGWARAEGVTPGFSMNILDGGVVDKTGTWDCPGTGGKGTLAGRCRMTADQVRTYGRAIGPEGCVMLMWRYDDAFMAKSTNVSAFRDVASLLASKPRRSCKRPG
jgi:hypothetical protein